MFKFEKCVTYANERTDDVIRLTQNNMKRINSAISVNLRQGPLKLGSSAVNTPTGINTIDSYGNLLFSSPVSLT